MKKLITPIRKLARKWHDPAYIANNLIQSFGEKGFIWLDSDGSSTGRWTVLATNPTEQICCSEYSPTQQKQNPFELLRNLKAGHWTGWLSYEAGVWIEPNNPWKKDAMATLWIARHDPVIKFDLIDKQIWIEGTNPQQVESLDRWLQNLRHENNQNDLSKKIGIPVNSWKWLINKTDFAAKVNLIKKLIRAGDIFQANLATSCTTQKPSEIFAIDLFQKLRQISPAPFSGIIIAGDKAIGEAVISTSPERFLQVDPSGLVETRPIKGTRPRNNNPQVDADMAAQLVCSQKDRAENIMIVDLLRNDLGKVCESGSIKVTQLAGLESYAQVHHLTSVIHGTLKTGKTWIDLLEACWPGGSISGAPKVRACQRIDELEPTARGPYCGSFIHIDWDGQFDSNILIRSLMVNGSTLRINAGCGIVADSDAENEVEELKWKLMPILKALE
ncbi:MULTISPECIES: anthranilate synthase component I family protein [Prochlorococcus]|uniref:anthranilate synthase component I family protein n=1 Tax=Prochlorococcus TaxID=1218 RepID=UPI000533B9A0|nr:MULTISPECIES: anthranilate synthase component I family protein [Prochlorococcus]KGG13727.1 Para-aminobenzoate synthase [Prochlorococcus sp. MIT 0601]